MKLCRCCAYEPAAKGFVFCEECMEEGVSIFGKDVDYKTGKTVDDKYQVHDVVVGKFSSNEEQVQNFPRIIK